MKKYLGLVLVSCMMLSLVACGGSDETDNDKGSTTAVTTQATTAAAETTTAAATEAQTEAATEVTTAETVSNSIVAYYEDGTSETLVDNGDGTYSTSSGTLYYLGDDGVLRARGASDLYVNK